jgi:hypothetical protein
MDYKDNKIVKIKGGLGNQLFQYSLALYLKKKFNFKVKIDISWFETQNKRSFVLPEYLNLDFDVIIDNKKYFSDKILSYRSEKLITHMLKNKITLLDMYNGYWQDIFFAKYLSEDNFKQNFFSKNLEENEYYVVHYRSDDFKKSKSHKVLSMDYYRRNLNFLKNKKLFLLTNNIEDFDDDIIIENDIKYLNCSEKDAFKFIYFANGGIASNSTFCWWPIFLRKKNHWILPNDWLRKKNLFQSNLSIENNLIV